ncbi:MAG: hypothetical protein QOE33_2245 [Acidobacteriota bacterium]|nr:hypothetical protein [Acidobacteriota bacterium]
MNSRRITIEGNRYLVFYTFDDEPQLGAVADAGAQLSAQPNDTNTSANAQLRDTDPLNVSSTDEVDQAVAHPRQISTDEQIATRSKPREGEDRIV